jgi:hypothetical protein
MQFVHCLLFEGIAFGEVGFYGAILVMFGSLQQGIDHRRDFSFM